MSFISDLLGKPNPIIKALARIGNFVVQSDNSTMINEGDIRNGWYKGADGQPHILDLDDDEIQELRNKSFGNINYEVK